jgi:hypothetical protein
MIGVNHLRQKLERKKGSQKQILKDLQIAKSEEKHISAEIIITEQAQVIIQIVAQKTQKELQYRLSDIASLALAAVFDDPYTLKADFVVRRGKTECDLLFKRRGRIFDPLTSTGGGAVDVAAIASQVAMWSLTRPRTRNVLILDEPFSHLKGVGPNIRAIQMMKMISKEANIQMIIISDERAPIEDIKNGADKVFQITIKGGISKATVCLPHLKRIRMPARKT